MDDKETENYCEIPVFTTASKKKFRTVTIAYEFARLVIGKGVFREEVDCWLKEYSSTDIFDIPRDIQLKLITMLKKRDDGYGIP